MITRAIDKTGVVATIQWTPNTGDAMPTVEAGEARTDSGTTFADHVLKECDDQVGSVDIAGVFDCIERLAIHGGIVHATGCFDTTEENFDASVHDNQICIICNCQEFKNLLEDDRVLSPAMQPKAGQSR